MSPSASGRNAGKAAILVSLLHLAFTLCPFLYCVITINLDHDFHFKCNDVQARPSQHLCMQHISANVQFGHKQFENPSKIPIVVTVKAKGYSQLEYILHLFLKITISAYYNYLQVKIIFLSNMEPVFLLLPPWQVSPNWGRTHCGTNTSIQSLNTHFQPLAFLNQTSSRSSYHSDQEDSIIN